jgi:hypothetical protein
MDNIFISYSRKDRAFATRLQEALKARQRQAWVDLEDIPPTAEWREKIKAGIEGARAFVFVQTQFPPTSQRCPPARTRRQPYPSKLGTRNSKLLFKGSFGSGKSAGKTTRT